VLTAAVAVGCDKNFCEDFPNSEWCSPSEQPPPEEDTTTVSCPDTGSTAYFPLSVGASWTYHVVEGSGLDSADDNVINPTGNEWDERLVMVDDSTWITAYLGGPYDGAADTAYVFLRSDTLYMRVIKSTSIGGSSITIAAESPFAWYPLRRGDSISTRWDTLPPADYIGGDSVPDTIEYRITTVVLDTTSYTVDSQRVCAQKVLYRTTLHIINLGATVELKSYFWWSPYRGVVKRVERNLRDTSNIRWLQKDLITFTLP